MSIPKSTIEIPNDQLIYLMSVIQFWKDSDEFVPEYNHKGEEVGGKLLRNIETVLIDNPNGHNLSTLYSFVPDSEYSVDGY
jgi:hypothetical protein